MSRNGFRCIFCGEERFALTKEWAQFKPKSAVICAQCIENSGITLLPVNEECTILAAELDPDNRNCMRITIDKVFLPDAIIGNKVKLVVHYKSNKSD